MSSTLSLVILLLEGRLERLLEPQGGGHILVAVLVVNNYIVNDPVQIR